MTQAGHLRLEDISTCWPEVTDPLRFTLRYAPAIQAYLRAQIRHANDVEDVLQDFLLNVVRHRFRRAEPDKGRFRDYLKAAVQRAVYAYFRGQATSTRHEQLDSFELVDDPGAGQEQWLVAWRDCLLERAWEALWRREQTARRARYHTVLRLATDHPEQDSVSLAAVATREAGVPISAAAFRQQLHRAREAFARMLCEEVAQTMRDPSPQAVREELGELGLLSWLEKHLPA